MDPTARGRPSLRVRSAGSGLPEQVERREREDGDPGPDGALAIGREEGGVDVRHGGTRCPGLGERFRIRCSDVEHHRR
jgi:hypothetical protein